MNDQILIVSRAEFTASVPGTFLDKKERALATSALIGVVSDALSQESAIESLRDIKTLRSSLEKARVSAKAPVLDFARAIDKAAKDADKELAEEEARIASAVAKFQEEELIKAREKELERQRELDRIENEKREAEYQARRQAEEEEKKRRDAEAAAEAERKKKQAEAEAAQRAAQEAKTAKARKAAQEEADKKRLEAEDAARKELEEKESIQRERAESASKAQAEQEAITQRAIQAQEAIGGPVVPTQASGQRSTPQNDFEVFDIYALARAHPMFVKIEPRRQEILDAINKGGMSKIPGVRVIEVIKTKVSAPRAIDV